MGPPTLLFFFFPRFEPFYISMHSYQNTDKNQPRKKSRRSLKSNGGAGRKFWRSFWYFVQATILDFFLFLNLYKNPCKSTGNMHSVADRSHPSQSQYIWGNALWCIVHLGLRPRWVYYYSYYYYILISSPSILFSFFHIFIFPQDMHVLKHNYSLTGNLYITILQNACGRHNADLPGWKRRGGNVNVGLEPRPNFFW